MPRPRKGRWVQCHPRISLFKPQGVPAAGLAEVVLSVEGLEALRLADLEGFEQEQAAALMGVSRPTFSRMLAEARMRVAEALVEGLALRIEGGDFVVGSPPGAETDLGPGGSGRSDRPGCRGRGGRGFGRGGRGGR